MFFVLVVVAASILLSSVFDARGVQDNCRTAVVVIVETPSFVSTALLPPSLLLPLTKSGLPLIAVRDI
jgi:hypothetical protein